MTTDKPRKGLPAGSCGWLFLAGTFESESQCEQD